MNLIETIKEQGLVVVVRGKTPIIAEKTVEACVKGGLKLIEITFTVPNAAELIGKMAAKYNNTDVLIGAGTVMNAKTAELAVLSGAKFIVSPNFNPEIAAYCKSVGKPYLPGVFTPTEIAKALDLGLSMLKLFPGDIARPQGLKALKGPFPQADFMVTGGVSFDNLAEWFKAGALCVGAGSNLTAKAKDEDYDGVTRDTEMWLRRIKELRG